MNTKTLGILIVLTIAVLAAALVIYSRRASDDGAQDTELLYADLVDRINDVAEVTVASADISFTLASVDGVWTMQSKHGYPADFTKLRSAIVGLTQLKVVESKTSDPGLYSRIGVAPVDEPGSTSTMLTVRDNAGSEMASLIVGEQSFHGREQRHYVRKASESGSWLVSGRLPLDTDPMSWLNRDIIRVPHARVKAVQVSHPDPAMCVSVYRHVKAVRNFVVDDIPEGYMLHDESSGNIYRAAISGLRFDDVVPESEHPHDEDSLVTATFETFDGLHVVVRTSLAGDETWATIEASYVEPDQPVDPDDPADTEELRQAARDTAAEVTARSAGWAYKLGAGQGINLRKPMGDLIKPIDAVTDVPSAPGFQLPPGVSGQPTLPVGTTTQPAAPGSPGG